MKTNANENSTRPNQTKLASFYLFTRETQTRRPLRRGGRKSNEQDLDEDSNGDGNEVDEKQMAATSAENDGDGQQSNVFKISSIDLN